MEALRVALALNLLLGERTLSAALRDRITAAAAGNPLFIEQFAAMLIEEGMLAANTRTLPVPPTLQALLTARLERLGPEERQVLTRAAVAGQTFYETRAAEHAERAGNFLTTEAVVHRTCLPKASKSTLEANRPGTVASAVHDCSATRPSRSRATFTSASRTWNSARS